MNVFSRKRLLPTEATRRVGSEASVTEEEVTREGEEMASLHFSLKNCLKGRREI